MSYLPASEMHGLGIHFGPPVSADCFCDGQQMRRIQKSGDIDVVPAGVDGSWKDDTDCQTLQMRVSQSLIRQAASDLGRDVANTELRPRFQLRDPRIEAIGWAVKATLEADTPSEALYINLLAQALAVRLIEIASDSPTPRDVRADHQLPPRQLRILTDYIEGNLDQKLPIAHLASIAGISATTLKALFRNSTGLPVHQYIIRRRVEYARALISTTDLPLSEIATKTGFSHQSHMATTMRRLLGHPPSDITRRPIGLGPNLHPAV